MKYAWAAPGVHVQYIGPPVLHKFVGNAFHGAYPAPFAPNVKYVIASVNYVIPQYNRGEVVLCIVGFKHIRVGANLFRPLQDKDTEMFNELLKDVPADLLEEQVETALNELEKAWADG